MVTRAWVVRINQVREAMAVEMGMSDLFANCFP